MLGDLDPQSHLVLVITLQRTGCGPHVMDDNYKAKREAVICPRPHRYQMTELDSNLGLADSKACPVLCHWLGLLALENLPLPSSPVGIVSTSTGQQGALGLFTQPLPRVNGKRSWLAGPKRFSGTAPVGLCGAPHYHLCFPCTEWHHYAKGESPTARLPRSGT